MASMRCDHFAKPIEPTLKGFFGALAKLATIE
jgi:hypothetical protein